MQSPHYQMITFYLRKWLFGQRKLLYYGFAYLLFKIFKVVLHQATNFPSPGQDKWQNCTIQNYWNSNLIWGFCLLFEFRILDGLYASIKLHNYKLVKKRMMLACLLKCLSIAVIHLGFFNSVFAVLLSQIHRPELWVVCIWLLFFCFWFVLFLCISSASRLKLPVSHGSYSPCSVEL
jgi:hypothetical protein